jgi:glycine cleavage system H protein
MRYNSSNFKLNSDSFVVKYQEAGPKSVKFTEEHEWIAFQRDDSVFLGITQYASEALGEATFVELPEVGDTVEVGESIGSVESVKSASEIYSPVAGEIVAVNEELESRPQLISDDPMGNAWIAQIKLNEPAEVVEGQESLLSETQYEELLDSN